MDYASSAALAAADSLVARSGGLSSDPSSRPPVYKIVGLILAISSGLFIGVSFVLKKVGLLKANAKYNEEAGEGYGYLKNFYWWGGMTLMIIGEVCNFVAYAFVDAILVTPLGALSVVVTTILSAIFLKERLSFVGKVGCFNCIIGSVVIVINAPTQSAVATIQDMKDLVIAPGFLSYAGVIIVGCTFMAFWAGPRYGKKNMLVYLTICSLVGGLSVVATQGLGAAVVTQIAGTPQFNQWFLYVLLVFVIATLLVEIVYLNKALNLFNAALVTPTYYVYFTSSTIVTSAILFQGFKGTAASISTVIMGFLQICAGVVLLQLSKSAKDVPDAAVFSGDLDQVRTVAEQEEPEYEPRADTVRGGGAILRSMSVARQKKQMEEAKRLHDERMEAIGEDEQVEWDGLRRRKTISEPGRNASLQRRKTLHPPLGMSHFPDDDEENQRNSEEDTHPGIFTNIRKRAHTSSFVPGPFRQLSTHLQPSAHDTTQHHPVGLSTLSPTTTKNSDGPPPTPPPHKHSIYGFGHDGAHDVDTTYKSPAQSSIHWAHDVNASSDSRNSSLAPPQPPPHTARRQFSFQNMFHRRRHSNNASEGAISPGQPGSGAATPGAAAADGGGGSDGSGRSPRRPGTARSALSFTGRKGALGPSETEEERLGLVKGDSQVQLERYDDDDEDDASGGSNGARRGAPPPPGYDDDDEWQVTSPPPMGGARSPVSGVSPHSRAQAQSGGGVAHARGNSGSESGSEGFEKVSGKDLEGGGGSPGDVSGGGGGKAFM
ncbi:magnesium transporter NIPA-domain-containing protein [Lineolata rhizophorae]|uniref:Magnesium transporter NIPA-domain-containing protein n=1 Tax=Lineolata rhizophorae TaxID=578093 RepID=A0A6A6P214_9PEZI|nr:magnesium transporter NIPA-domain-containing protein [Lineolata rhizophorae]